MTIEAQNNLESGTSFMRNTIDSLQYQVEFKLTKYYQDSGSISTNEKVERQRELYFLQQNLARVQEQLQQKATQKDAKLTEGVLNQINAFVEQYGKKHGFKIILGTNNSGTLLYADEATDITDDLLEALNKDYRGKH